MVDKKSCFIVGGGISGLALAWFLKRQYGNRLEIKVLEALSQTGGAIQTSMHGGFLFESGPHSWRGNLHQGAFAEMIAGLNLQAEVIEATGRYRYLYFDKQLHLLPHSFLSLLTSRFGWMALKAFWRDLWAPKGPPGDESVASFISRRLGADMAELCFDPLLSGIYAGDINQLSMISTFSALKQWEQEQGSLWRGMLQAPKPQSAIKVCSFKKGMRVLVEALTEALFTSIQVNAKVKKVHFAATHVSVQLNCGTYLKADHIFLAAPASALAPLFEEHSRTLSSALAGIKTVSLAVVNLGYRQRVLRQEGFGYLIPQREQEKILGILWDSSAFPQQAQRQKETRLSVMLGGAHFKEFDAYTQNEFLKLALKGVQQHLKINEPPHMSAVHMIKDGLPQYNVGHAATVRYIEEELGRLSNRIQLLGNSFYGVGLNDCVEQAKRRALAFSL